MAKKKEHLKIEVLDIEQKLAQRKATHLKNLQDGIDKNWGDYSKLKEDLDSKKTALKTAVDEDAKAEKRKAVKEHLVNLESNLKSTKDFVGGLSEDFATRLNLSIQKRATINFDLFYPTELAFINNERYRSGNSGGDSYLQVTSDKGLKEDLAELKELYEVRFEKLKGDYQIAFDTYENKHGKDSLKNWTGNLAERKSVDDASMSINKLAEKMHWLAKAIEDYSNQNKKSLNPDELKLVTNAKNCRVDVVDKNMIDLGSKKPTPVLYRPKEKSAKDVKNLIKTDPSLALDGILTLSANTLGARFTKIKDMNALYLTKLDEIEAAEKSGEGAISKLIEQARDLVFQMRNSIKEWLDEHQGDTGEKQIKQGQELLDLDKRLQKHISLVANIALSQDNFLEIQKAYDEIAWLVPAWQDLWHVSDKCYKEYEAVKEKGTDEAIQEKVDAYNKADAAFDDCSKNTIAPKLTAYIAEATAWKKKHDGMKGFAIKKKQNTIVDALRECYTWASYVDGFKMDPKILKTQEPYDPSKDKLLKEILKQKAEILKLNNSDDYKKRFRFLGDLNGVIQEWQFKHRNYSSEELGESEKTILETKDVFVFKQHDAVTAHMSIDGLEKGMNDNLKGYCKFVSDYNSKKLGKELMPELMKGSTALIEFLDIWDGEYKKLLDSKVDVPDKRKKAIEVLKAEHDKLRKTLVDNNLIILTGGMVDPDLDDKIAINREKIGRKSKELEDTKLQLAAKEQDFTNLMEQVKKGLIRVTELDLMLSKETDPAKKLAIQKKLAEVQEKLKAPKEKIAELVDDKDELISAIKGLNKEVDTLTAMQTQFEKRQSLKGNATSIYQQIVVAFEDKEAFQYEDNLDIAEQANRVDYINCIFVNIEKWEKEVLNPNLEQLANFKRVLEKIQADLEFHIKQFNAGRAYVDKTYDLIVNAYNVIAAIKDNDVNFASKTTFDQFLYCNKLIGYWKKENPTEIESNKAKFKEIFTKIGSYISDTIKSDRFIGLKQEKEAQDKLEALRAFVKEMHDGLDTRHREFNADKIYYGGDPVAKKALKDALDAFEKEFGDLFLKMNQVFVTVENDLAGSDPKRFENSISTIVKEENDFTKTCKVLQFQLHELMVKEEQLVFSVVGENDFDLYASNLDDDQIIAMSRSLENICERARAILKSGGSVQEAELMFSHIPVSLWPDEFVSELQAFKQVEKAFEEEQRELAQKEVDEEYKSLGITDFMLDIATAEGAKDVADKLSGTHELAMFKKWDPTANDGKGGYNDTTLDGKEQSPTHKALSNSLDWAVYGMEIFGTVKAFKNLPPEEQAKAAQDYLFTGKVDFETGEALSDPAAAHLSERKRVILLTGMKFVSSTANIIDKTADAYSGPGELMAACRGIMLFFNGLASAIEMYEDSTKVAKNSQEHWDKNMEHVVTIAKGLLGAGKTIADTFRLFQQIPSGVIPALGIASGVIDLAVDIVGIAKKISLQIDTTNLKEIAEVEDRAYVGPLKQEINSLNRRIAKQSIDIVADVAVIAGGITTASGVAAPVGTAITLAAGILKLGNELVFFGINEKLMADCRDMLKKARAGDRNAMMEIMEQSPMYAKMFIALGATKEPADQIALEFLRQRGITEKDLKDEGTSKWVVRKFVRTQLLDKAEEKDSHDSYFATVVVWKGTFDKWRVDCNKKTGFWQAGREDYQALQKIYSKNELNKLIADFSSKKDSWFSSTRQEVHQNATLIKGAFDAQKNYVVDALEDTEIALEQAIDKDKNEVSNTFELLVKQLESKKEGLTGQEQYLSEILSMIAPIFN